MSGKPAARVGDKVAGNVIVSGSATVLIGDAGQGQADKPCKNGVMVGSPVNPLLGAKVLPAEVDFALPAPVPLVFTRSYASDDARIGPLGQGWSVTGAGLSLQVDDTTTVFIDPQGRRITFCKLVPGQLLFSPSENIWLRRGAAEPMPVWAGRWMQVPLAVQRDPDCIAAMFSTGHEVFVFRRTPSHWQLRFITDRYGYRTDFRWSSSGDLHEMRDSAGHIFSLIYHSINCGDESAIRLAGVVLAYDPLRDGPNQPPFDPLSPNNDWLVRYYYSDAGDLIEVRNRLRELVRRFDYLNHVMVGHVEPSGHSTKYIYDQPGPEGRVLVQSHVDGLIYHFDYQANLTRVTDNLGRCDEYRYAGEGGLKRLTHHVRADGSVIKFEYDLMGRLIAIADGLGRTTRYRLDGEGRHIGLRRADGSLESRRYDPVTCDLIGITDALGLTVRIERDAMGRIKKEIKPEGGEICYVYDDERLPDRPTKIFDQKGGERTFTWTALGQLATWTDCSGHRTECRYDSNGFLECVTDALKLVTQFKYDRMGRISLIAWPDGATLANDYDLRGNMIGQVDALGRATRWKFDRHGRVIRKINPQGHELGLIYDVADRLQAVVNEKGERFEFQFDALDRVVAESGFDQRRRQYFYNAAGELIGLIDADGAAQQFIYDRVGRMIEHRIPASEGSGAYSVYFMYDANGKVIEARSPDAVVKLSYDLGGRLISETQCHSDGWSYHHHHRLDALGMRESSYYDGLPEIQWMRYGAGHWHGLRVGRVGVDLERDSLFREVRREVSVHGISGGISGELSFDQLGRVVVQKMNCKTFDGTELSRTCRYQYDVVGQVLEIVRDNNTDLFQYDMEGKVVAGRRGGVNHCYRYDPAGNRFDVDESSIVGNRLKVMGGYHYCHDPMGRVVERISPQGERLLLQYDGISRMVAMEHDKGNGQVLTACYRHDPFGRRIRKEVKNKMGKSVVTRFGWDGDRVVAQVTAERQQSVLYEPGSFVPLLTISNERMKKPRSELEAVLTSLNLPWQTNDLTDEGCVSLFFVDSLGTPLQMVSLDGSIVWEAVPDDWAGSRPVNDSIYELTQPIRFQGQWLDAESGLHYNRHRYYDPIAGRYLTQDPLGLAAGLNPYAYAHGNPVSFIDPLGLDAIEGLVRNQLNRPEFSRVRGTPAGSCVCTYQGKTFSAPPRVDFSAAHQAGKNAWPGYLGVPSKALSVGHFGEFDYQRNSANNQFTGAYTDASNFSVGAYMHGAGYSKEATVDEANSFAKKMSSNAGSPAQEEYWRAGWDAAEEKKLGEVCKCP